MQFLPFIWFLALALKPGWAQGHAPFQVRQLLRSVEAAKPPKVAPEFLLLVSPKEKPVRPEEIERRRLQEFYRVFSGPWDSLKSSDLKTLLVQGSILDLEREEEVDLLSKGLLPHPLISASLVLPEEKDRRSPEFKKPANVKLSKMLDPRVRLKPMASVRRLERAFTTKTRPMPEQQSNVQFSDQVVNRFAGVKSRQKLQGQTLGVSKRVQLKEIHPIRDLSPLHPSLSETRVTPARFMDLPEAVFKEEAQKPSDRRSFVRVGNRRSRATRRGSRGVRNETSLKVLRRRSRAGLAKRRREHRWR